MNYRLTILAVLLSLWSHAAFADAALARTLHLGESAELTFDKLKAASVGNPAVADIAPLTTRHLLVTGKGLGQTTVFAFDRHGRHVYKFTVTAAESDLSPVAAQIQQEIGLPEVTARAVRDTILLEGSIASDLASERAETIAGVYAAKVKNLLTVHDSVKTESGSKTADAEVFATLLNDNLQASGIQAKALDSETLVLSGKYVPLVSPSVTGAGSGSGAAGKRSRKLTDETTEVSNPVPSTPDPLTRLLASLPPDLRVVNLLNFPAHAPQQILVRAKVIDIDRGSEKKLGIAWGSLGISDSGRTGRTYSLQSQPILFGQSPAEFLPSLLSGGNFQRVLPFAAQVNALISENKARVLSEPSLVVLDGNSGSLLVGGEIPIPVAQTNTGSGGATLTVEYKQFGVLLNVTATITHDGLIQMTATPEVSDLDYSDAVQFNGFTIPALSVRRATSTLQMRDGETLVISGLYSNQSSRQVQRIPLLSQIPFIGEFFKTTSTKKTESELLILLTPQIVQPGMAATQPPPQGSPENLPLIKPDVRARDFDRDFPDLDGRKDRATGRAGHP